MGVCEVGSVDGGGGGRGPGGRSRKGAGVVGRASSRLKGREVTL